MPNNWLPLVLLLPLLSLGASQLPLNGGFEEIQNGFPTHWSAGAINGELGKDVLVNLSPQAYEGKFAIELKTLGKGDAILNSEPLSILKGEVKFYYKALSSDGKDNLAIFVIPLDKNGRETSPGRAQFIIPKEHIGDGKWHRGDLKFDFINNLNVEKVLIGVRINESGMAGAGHLLVDDISLKPANYHLSPNLLLSLSFQRPLYLPNEKPQLHISIRNEGRVASEPGSLKVIFQNFQKDFPLPSLDKGKVETFSLELPPLKKAGIYTVKAMVEAGDVRFVRETPLIVVDDLAKKGLSLEFANSRLLFPFTSQGYGAVLIQFKKDGQWRNVALIPSLFTLETETASAEAYSTSYTRSRSGLTFKGKLRCGVDWDFEVRYRMDFSTQQFVLSLQCKPSKDVPLYALRFPRIYVGERSFGEKKSYGLFPGLEFLKGNERSSSTRDANPPASDRWAPHPYKITIPLMAISSPDCTVALLWDENQKWNGEDIFPSALFASPNFLEGGNNHLLSLFIPSIPKWGKENSLQAEPPYTAKAGKPLTLTCRLALTDGEDILSAIREWKKAFGLPKPKLPRQIAEEMELCANCYTDVIWDEKAFGWLPWTGVPPQLDVNVSFVLLKLANYIQDASLREKTLNLAKRTLHSARPAGSLEVAFRLGELEEALKNARNSALDSMKSQKEDGSWVFQPDEQRKTLGKEGETEIGICAPPASNILRWALLSGDREALDKGLLALKFMDRFYIPAGAQTWECPLHAPDIYASAVAIPPYLYAYEITKDKHYLERAKELAMAGIPFVYLWKSPERQRVMLGATIPIFGATFYVLPWFARPVQWNGLAYAHSLRLLSQYDDSFPWQDIADLILQSAMEQQAIEGQYKGLYPDSFELISNTPYAPWLAPILILRNLFWLSGDPLDIHFKVLDTPKGKVHIACGVKFSASYREGRIDIETERGDLASSYLTIAPINSPSVIKMNGASLEQTSSPEEVEKGWRYLADWKMVVVKITGEEKSTIELDFSSP